MRSPVFGLKWLGQMRTGATLLAAVLGLTHLPALAAETRGQDFSHDIEPILAELPFNAGMADQPIAALIADLKQRGLLDETLVVWASEFGRTPLGENRPGSKANTGRDHHPFSFTMLLCGGGIRGGTVYGRTDEIGWGIHESPVHINDLHATILQFFGLDNRRLTYRFQGRDFRLTDVGANVMQAWIG